MGLKLVERLEHLTPYQDKFIEKMMDLEDEYHQNKGQNSLDIELYNETMAEEGLL